MENVLSGYTIGVTAHRRSGEQIQMLEGRGATCLHGPMLDTKPLLPEAEIAAATKLLIDEPPAVTILTTGIGVRGWFSAADALFLGEALRHSIALSMVFARGPKSSGAAITAGIDVAWNAPNATISEVLDELESRDVRGQRVAIQLDGDPDSAVIERLEQLGADVVPVPVYRWTMPSDLSAAEGLVQAVAEHRVDALTFTARPAVENFVQIARDLGVYAQVCEATRTTTRLFSVGERTAEALRESGLGPSEFPDRPQLGSMVMRVTERLRASATELEMGGHHVVLRGREVRVNGSDPAVLTARERHLFAILASRPGAVFSKANLLAEVWRGDASDEHVVEVTVGRLRRRLGEAGEGIETVMRRGYRVRAA